MQTYVLIQTIPDDSGVPFADRVADMPGVRRVVNVEGPYDVVVEIDEDSNETLPQIVSVDGVLRAIPLHVSDTPALSNA